MLGPGSQRASARPLGALLFSLLAACGSAPPPALDQGFDRPNEKPNVIRKFAEDYDLSKYDNIKFLSDSDNKGSLSVNLKYNNGEPVIKEIKRVSKPGRRIYVRATSIPKIQNGLGLAIVSTSIGIMTDNEARSKNVGGEIICKVF